MNINFEQSAPTDILVSKRIDLKKQSYGSHPASIVGEVDKIPIYIKYCKDEIPIHIGHWVLQRMDIVVQTFIQDQASENADTDRNVNRYNVNRTQCVN